MFITHKTLEAYISELIFGRFHHLNRLLNIYKLFTVYKKHTFKNINVGEGREYTVKNKGITL